MLHRDRPLVAKADVFNPTSGFIMAHKGMEFSWDGYRWAADYCMIKWSITPEMLLGPHHDLTGMFTQPPAPKDDNLLTELPGIGGSPGYTLERVPIHFGEGRTNIRISRDDEPPLVIMTTNPERLRLMADWFAKAADHMEKLASAEG